MKSNYEERKQNRLDYYENQAAKNEKASEQLYDSAKKMADVIPFGQPILVGHHSEKRDRNYRNRIHNTFGKSFEANKKAQYYRDKAESLLNGTAISSDDPSAIDKLQEKVEKLEALQELYKAINKVVRSKKSEGEKVGDLVALGIMEQTAVKLLEKGEGWHNQPGIPSYRLTNNNANIRRIRERVEHLQRISAIQSSEEEINGVRLVISQEDNRVQIFFGYKPSEEIRRSLKAAGFRWAPSIEAWMRQTSNHAINLARQILSNLK